MAVVIAIFLLFPLRVVGKGELKKFLAEKRELGMVQTNVDQPMDVKDINMDGDSII